MKQRYLELRDRFADFLFDHIGNVFALGIALGIVLGGAIVALARLIR